MKAIIKGGYIPKGKVKVSGAKNSATRLLAAAVLSDSEIKLNNFPINLVDAQHKIRFLREIGASIEENQVEQSLIIDASNIQSKLLSNYDFPIRTTYLLVAAQIKRNGRAYIPYPGGCQIGARGYDLHLYVWKQLGCEVYEREGYIEVIGKEFVGSEIKFPISTVGGTENALICSSVAKGTTQIKNAYITPEVEDLIEFLQRMGADISVNGASHIEVKGVSSLRGATKDVMFDRIEALTWLVYGVMSKGDIQIENVPFDSMDVPLLHVRKSGIDFFNNESSIYFNPTCLKRGRIEAFEVSCGAHPGVISDMQPFYTLLGMVADGDSRIFDYRYPERVEYARQLQKLTTSKIEVETGKIVVRGGGEFRPGVVDSTDLRGSMALVLAALCAEGESVVNSVHMALRGYNNLSDKLSKLGVPIELSEE